MMRLSSARLETLFVVTARERAARLVASTGPADAKSLAHELHTLQGEAAVMGHPTLAAACRAALESVRRTSDLAVDHAWRARVADVAAAVAALPPPDDASDAAPLPEPTRPRSVLLIDDSDANRMTLGALLEDAGLAVTEADSLAAARATLQAGFGLAIIDLHLGDGHGTSLIAELRAACPGIVVALWTGDGDDPSLMRAGADLVLTKGEPAAAMLARLQAAVVAP
jgi:CheY-like chemotaxis protein